MTWRGFCRVLGWRFKRVLKDRGREEKRLAEEVEKAAGVEAVEAAMGNDGGWGMDYV